MFQKSILFSFVFLCFGWVSCDDSDDFRERMLQITIPVNRLTPEPDSRSLSSADLESQINNLRAYCFKNGQRESMSTEYSVNGNEYSLGMLVTQGKKHVAVIANTSPDISAGLDDVYSYEELSHIDVGNVNAYAFQYGLPMSCFFETTVSSSSTNNPRVLINRSVAKVELFLKKSKEYEDDGLKVFIKAGTNFVLNGAVLNTSLTTRENGTPQYGTIPKEFPQEIEITTSADKGICLFEAYIGDHASADVSDLSLAVEWEVRRSDGSVLEHKTYHLNYGKYNLSGTNSHIHRNFIYRINGEISKLGNIEAAVIDWNTMKTIDVVFGKIENVGAETIPWNELDYGKILDDLQKDNPLHHINTGIGDWTDLDVRPPLTGS
ncbi:fimbrial protein [uncultured Parabacteroides sp.]|uniref:fimbrial protein n=1 Tax=uncultured Parabacteroides sp. TaxID=512312 RepID=UPI0025CBDB49|nr:fimbrial protein [uncultured Parabacteroides sp.]